MCVQYVKELIGGEYRNRTDDLLHAMQALSQLSYNPKDIRLMVEVNGIEPLTLCLQSRCSPS